MSLIYKYLFQVEREESVRTFGAQSACWHRAQMVLLNFFISFTQWLGLQVHQYDPFQFYGGQGNQFQGKKSSDTQIAKQMFFVFFVEAVYGGRFSHFKWQRVPVLSAGVNNFVLVQGTVDRGNFEHRGNFERFQIFSFWCHSSSKKV